VPLFEILRAEAFEGLPANPRSSSSPFRGDEALKAAETMKELIEEVANLTKMVRKGQTDE